MCLYGALSPLRQLAIHPLTLPFTPNSNRTSHVTSTPPPAPQGTCRGPDGRPTPLSAWVATRCAALVADHPLSPPHHGRDPHYAPHAPHRLAPSARSDTQFASKVPHGRGRGLDGKEATLGGHPAAYVHAGSHPAPAGLPPATADAGLYADYHAQVASADVDEYDIDAFL